MSRTCGFCGRPRCSKEHLWPKWVLKIIRDVRGTDAEKEFVVEHEKRGKTIRFRSTNMETKVGMPCEKCNNGWMSALESSVKPFLGEMIRTGDVTFLTEERRQLLATWIVKTAMVYEFFKPDGRFYFSDQDRREFMNYQQPPNDVHVWIAKYDATQPMHGSQDRLTSDGRLVHFYCLTLTANFLAMQIAASREIGARRRVPVSSMPKGSLQRIWPAAATATELVKWPPPVTLGSTALKTLDTRFRNR